jgi:peptidyl-prolyl cis-trans isomerase A (cyclophilin A)
MLFRSIFTVLVLLGVFAAGGCKHEKIATTPPPKTDEGSQSVKRPIAVIETTMGTFKFELYTDKAPITAKNFIDLANKGYYNGVIFHRVVKDFVIQGGDPTGTGSGGPGHTIKLETSPDLKHDKPGVVAMARTSDPDSAGSQFYVTVVPTPFLDPGARGPGYAIFGQVIDGLDVVYAISKVEVGANDRPLKEVKMTKVTIEQPK